MRAQKTCRASPSELQTEPYTGSASYDQNTFWKVPSKNWHMLQERNPVFKKRILFPRTEILFPKREILFPRREILLSGEGPFGTKTSRLQEAQVGPGLARQEFSRPPLFRGGRACFSRLSVRRTYRHTGACTAKSR